MLTGWEYSGPDSGIASKARVKVRAGGRTDVIDIEITAAEPPTKIVEPNVRAGGRRIANGTHLLHDISGGGTRVTLGYAWKQAPLSEQLAARSSYASCDAGSNADSSASLSNSHATPAAQRPHPQRKQPRLVRSCHG